MTHANLLGPEPTYLPDRPDAQAALDAETSPSEVAAEHPDFSEAWAELAETALGMAGVLGPAGQGGQIYKNPAITLTESGGQSGTIPVTIQNQLMMDGTQIRLVAGQEVQAQLEGLTYAVQMN